MPTITEGVVLKALLHLFTVAVVIANGSLFGQSLAEQIMDADEKQFVVLFPKLKEHAEQAVPVLTSEIERKLPSDANDDDKEKLAKRQANAAVALLGLGRNEKVWPLLKHSPDPRVRSYLIHRMAPLGVNPNTIIKRLNDEPDITIRRALLLSLGEFDEQVISLEDRKKLLPRLHEMYRTDPDPGLHAASEWLLREWDDKSWLKQFNEEWAKNKEQREMRLDRIEKSLATAKAPPQWYVNGQGQTMVVIPGPVEFTMGSPVKEKGRRLRETLHRRRISRTFALSAKLVTVEQYLDFDPEHKLLEKLNWTADLPVVKTSWYNAAEYCNWLSKQEGIPEDQWCFEITDADIKSKDNYLSLIGYRLPTEAEMEYATRAGAITARYYGETHELLPMYAWWVWNSQKRPWPVGSLKPNDFGLFDTLGNAYTWCQDSGRDYPIGDDEDATEDKEDDLSDRWEDRRALRGDSYLEDSSSIRSAFRNRDEPITSVVSVGFRLARTIKPLPSATNK